MGKLIVVPGTIVVPRDDVLRTSIIAEAHDPIVSGHFGMAKTYEKVKRSFLLAVNGKGHSRVREDLSIVSTDETCDRTCNGVVSTHSLSVSVAHDHDGLCG